MWYHTPGYFSFPSGVGPGIPRNVMLFPDDAFISTGRHEDLGRHTFVQSLTRFGLVWVRVYDLSDNGEQTLPPNPF